MSKENSNQQTLSKLQEARALLDECIAELGGKRSRANRKTARPIAPIKPSGKPDFTQPLRPFIKRHAKEMSGPKKFTLVLSWLAKGDLKKEVALKDIHKQWDRMTTRSLLGMEFNRFYAGQAKDNDWVESKKQGFYNLRPSWHEIFTDK
jgi:hypothetical protein